jgi:hypothetical protein
VEREIAQEDRRTARGGAVEQGGRSCRGRSDEDEHLDAAIDEAIDLAATIAGEVPAPPVIAEPGGEPALNVRNKDGDVSRDDHGDEEWEEAEVDRDDQVKALRVEVRRACVPR